MSNYHKKNDVQKDRDSISNKRHYYSNLDVVRILSGIFLFISASFTLKIGHSIFYDPGGGFIISIILILESVISYVGIIFLMIRKTLILGFFGALSIIIETIYEAIFLFWFFIESMGYVRGALAILCFILLVFIRKRSKISY